MTDGRNPYFLLIYDYADDYLDRRDAYRKAHVELVEDLVAQGYLILAGALANPADQAYLCFQCPDKTIIESFVQQDPYVRNGLVRRYTIRDWMVVLGSACRNPVHSRDL